MNTIGWTRRLFEPIIKTSARRRTSMKKEEGRKECDLEYNFLRGGKKKSGWGVKKKKRGPLGKKKRERRHEKWGFHDKCSKNRRRKKKENLPASGEKAKRRPGGKRTELVKGRIRKRKSKNLGKKNPVSEG